MASKTEQLRGAFKRFGVEAQIFDHKVSNKYRYTRNDWIVEVDSGPIDRVEITDEYETFAEHTAGGESEKSKIDIALLIQDSRLDETIPIVSIHATRTKKFRWFGPITGVRWSEPHHREPFRWERGDSHQRNGLGARIIQQLDRDSSIMKSIENDRAWLVIESVRDDGHWIISKARLNPSGALSHDDLLELLGPTKQQWDAYEQIAQVILDTPLSIVGAQTTHPVNDHQ